MSRRRWPHRCAHLRLVRHTGCAGSTARLAQNEFWRGRCGIAIRPGAAAAGGRAVPDRAAMRPCCGLVGLLFGIAVLFYAWGPRDLDLDVEAIVEARDPPARREAAARLSPQATMPKTRAPRCSTAGTGRGGVPQRAAALVRRAVLVPAARPGRRAAVPARRARRPKANSRRALPPETAAGARTC